MLYIDDIVLFGESNEDLNRSLRRLLETRCFYLSRSKTKYIECKLIKGEIFLI